MLGLSNLNTEFQKLGTQLVGVFCQKAESVKQWATDNSVPFALLIDTDRQLAKDYGVYVRLSYDSFNIARPSNFLIDRSGVVRYVYVSSHQWDRCDSDRLLEEARKI